MRQDEHRKVTAGHLSRKAYLYVRQSTLRQVLENQESTRRQYALRERAVALGWTPEDVVVIDSDLGQSGASTADRLGFQRLVSEVGLGHAGIVMGLEVSRLARNSADWHRLIEICALTSTLILDEDGLYDPAHFNDRLLLGLKGTMSEAELHVLRARLRGGVLSKARRGELEMPLPAGLICTPDKQVVLDPDSRVQQTLLTFFATFTRTGSASATVKAFREQQLLFPSRRRPHSSDILWKPLTHSRALNVLHNPRFAGAFAFGRTESRKTVDGRTRSRLRPREEWIALIPGAHPGYITWEEFEANQARLRNNSRAHGSEKRRGPAREGPALLQGLVVCGLCGRRMTVRYSHRHNEKPTPVYVCQRDGIQHGDPMCQHITGTTIDDAVGDLLIELMKPMSIDITMAVQEELNARSDEIDRLHAKAVEQARHQADVARRRYMQVDPGNRLVADVLEAEWNNKLRALTEAQEVLERKRERHHATLSKQHREAVYNLVDDFPAVWRDPKTPHRERKRLLRLLVADVTLVKSEQLHVNVRLRGGQTRSLTLLRPLPAWALRKADPELVEAVDKLIEDHTDPQIVAILNERGYRSKAGGRVTLEMVRRLKKAYGLKSRRERLRAKGLLTMQELAAMLGVATSTIKIWRLRGLLVGHASDGRGHYLYEDPGPNPPRPQQGRPRKHATKTTLSLT